MKELIRNSHDVYGKKDLNLGQNLKKIELDENMHIESSDQNMSIENSFKEAAEKVTPLWDIRDYVAVNPFFGYKKQQFLDVAKYMLRISGESILPKKDFYLKKYLSGEITLNDLEAAKETFFQDSKNQTSEKVLVNDLLNFINLHEINKGSEKALPDQANKDDLNIRCVSDIYDYSNGTNVTHLITNELSRWLSVYFDEGQVTWKPPTEGQRFYVWWKSLVQYDNPFKENPNKGSPENQYFTQLIRSLSSDPHECLHVLTQILLDRSSILKETQLSDYYYRLFYTILGWSSYIQKFEFEAHRTKNHNKLNTIGGLIDILVARMTYDIALIGEISNANFDLNSNSINSNSINDKKIEKNKIETIDNICNIDTTDTRDTAVHPDRMKNLDYSYIWLNAAEISYRRSVQNKIIKINRNKQNVLTPDVQMVFCIDVRSEVIRRHLEIISPKIQTIGFAGFFGMPVSIKRLGHFESDQNCPVLLNSQFEINETSSCEASVLKSKKINYVDSIYSKKAIQSSANSGFSFVETFGFGYVKKMLSSSLNFQKPDINISAMGLSEVETKLIHLHTDDLTLDQKISLAFGALKNMGLTKNFAKYVFFFGHGSESSNNPYSSSLDCGACAGHNGFGNSKILADLLNNQEVRRELIKKGIVIPETTIFFSGWHNTTKDSLIIDKNENKNNFQDAESDLNQYIFLFDEASNNCREERANDLSYCHQLKGNVLHQELESRSKDWSEIRPEWGLARNSSFIVAQRDLTRGLSLEGRSFLHDYDYSEDSDLSRLELIMTAPMIVTNWINMQYYASTVNPKKFGTGNKVLNNVVGGIGCIQGNESDLLCGLSEQSVWQKGDYFHEPIRLQVFIESTTASIDKIVSKHEMLQDLISNNWLKIISIHPLTKEFRIFHDSSWSSMN